MFFFFFLRVIQNETLTVIGLLLSLLEMSGNFVLMFLALY